MRGTTSRPLRELLANKRTLLPGDQMQAYPTSLMLSPIATLPSVRTGDGGKSGHTFYPCWSTD